ncbi:MAG: ABC transporter permease [Clostridia bacterium]|nr:ABC transporter permease [Clostridia bacterium]
MQNNMDAVASTKKGIQFDNHTVAEFAKKYGALIVLIILVAVNVMFTPNFAKVNTMWNVLIQVSTVMLVALGMTIVISSGGIDISVGSIMAISSIVTAKLLPIGVLPAILIGLLIAAGFGLFSGFMISHFRIQPIIITLTLMISVRGIAQVVNNANLLNFTEPKFSFIGTHRIFGVIPVQVVIMIVAIAVVYFVMQRMTFGRYVQAMGDNHKASRLAGVNTFMTILAVYALSACMAGLAGLIETARLSAADANSIGKLMELDAIASVAVGGTAMSGGRANVIGTVIGALIMQVITVSVNMNNIPFSYSLVLKSIIIILAVYVQRERTA